MARAKTKRTAERTAERTEEQTELGLFYPLTAGWTSREEAIEYLGGRYAETLFALRELLLVGASGDTIGHLQHDLGEVAGALAAYLARGEGRVRVVLKPGEGESVTGLAALVGALQAKVGEDGVTVPCPDGREHEILGSSLRVLYEILAENARNLGSLAEERWHEEQRTRRLAITNERARARLEFEYELAQLKNAREARTGSAE